MIHRHRDLSNRRFTLELRRLFTGSLQSHFVSDTLDRIFCRLTGRGTASKTRYWAFAKADKIQIIISIPSHWAITEEWLTYWVTFGETWSNTTSRIIQLFNYLSLPNHTNYSCNIIDEMLLILARQQNRGCDYIENAYLASSQKIRCLHTRSHCITQHHQQNHEK